MHFLSDANETFGDLTDKAYPFAFMLACVGFLMTMAADCVISYLYRKQNVDSSTDVELRGNNVVITPMNSSDLNLNLNLFLCLAVNFEFWFSWKIFGTGF